MKKPAVSILLPVRNEERFLPAALDSIFRQTFTDWELVAVDDGSCDATPAILAGAAQRDPRVRVLRPSARGLVPALNAGLDACRAPLVARMDADDISHPRRLELQATFLSEQPLRRPAGLRLPLLSPGLAGIGNGRVRSLAERPLFP